MPSLTRAASLVAVATACLALPWWTAAQEPKGPVPQTKLSPDEEFWFHTPRQRAAAAAQLLALQNPLTTAAARVKLREEMVWGDLDFIEDTVPPLDADRLEKVVDGRPIPDIRGKDKKEIPRADWAMVQLYSEAVINAFEQPAEAFKRSAKENDYLKFGHLYTQPRIHRGKVVAVHGWMARLQKVEAPAGAREKGVRFVYVGWIFGETKRANPYAAIFPNLPEGLEIAEHMNRKVSFYGYFLGKIVVRVPGKEERGEDIQVPLVIGPTVYPATVAEAPLDDTPFSFVILVGVVAVLAGLMGVIVAISWWFRKGDKKIQASLAARQEQQVLDALNSPEQWNSPNQAAG